MIYNLSLNLHERKYDLSGGEIALSVFTITGIPYALRHKALSMEPATPNCLGHKILHIVQMIPIVGAIAAIIDYLASKIFASPSAKVKEASDQLEKLEKEIEEVQAYLNEKSEDARAIFLNLNEEGIDLVAREILISDLRQIIEVAEARMLIYTNRYAQYVNGNVEEDTDEHRLLSAFMAFMNILKHEFKDIKDQLPFV